MAASANTPVSGNSDRPDSKKRDLLEFAFNNVQSLVTSEESARLFPNGMESLDLEVGSDSDFRLSLKIRGRRYPTVLQRRRASRNRLECHPGLGTAFSGRDAEGTEDTGRRRPNGGTGGHLPGRLTAATTCDQALSLHRYSLHR